jgi:hypothetical protein
VELPPEVLVLVSDSGKLCSTDNAMGNLVVLASGVSSAPVIWEVQVLCQPRLAKLSSMISGQAERSCRCQASPSGQMWIAMLPGTDSVLGFLSGLAELGTQSSQSKYSY